MRREEKLHDFLPGSNTILEEGETISTGGVNDASRDLDALGIELKISPPRALHNHGWVKNFNEAKMLIASCYLTVLDTNGDPTTITCDIVEGKSPLIIGLDVKIITDTLNMSHQTTIRFRRPSENASRVLLAYIKTEETGNDLLRMYIVTHTKYTKNSLMDNVISPTYLNITKKVHRFTHATNTEIKDTFSDVHRLDDTVKAACDQVYEACSICVSSGRSASKKYISTYHDVSTTSHFGIR